MLPLFPNSTPYKGKGIPGSTLKIVAIVAMFLDHFSAIVLNGYLLQKVDAYSNTYSGLQTNPVFIVMLVLRCIGRLGFPLFCFLLIEGFFHTHNKLKYAGRLLLFAIISEVPFDLAFNHAILEFSYQNVFFTLFLGLVLMMATEKLMTRFKEQVALCTVLQLLLLGVTIAIAYVLRADYNYFGVVTIYLMYCFHNNRNVETLVGCFILTFSTIFEVFTFAIFPLTRRYNGERGINLKYFFYAFYPVHLLLLVGICYLLGYRS